MIAFKSRRWNSYEPANPFLVREAPFAALLKQFIEAALEAELDERPQHSGCNRKNGKTNKQLTTAEGTLDIGTPRDREASFEPIWLRSA